MGIFNIFKKDKKPKAIAFVDYEHWYISYDKMYHIKPDLHSWAEQLNQQYDMVGMHFFADYSDPRIASEVQRIREITNSIIETQNTSLYHKKDMTDFIMLDYIYQEALDGYLPDVIILFTGDGHFQSVVKYLVNKRKKKVVVYGVRDAFSNQLKTVASSYVEMPNQETVKNDFYEMIVKNFDYIATHPEKNIKATFNNTVAIVARVNHTDYSKVKKALSEMIYKGYILQKSTDIQGKTIKLLSPNWDKLICDGLYKANSK